MPHILLQEGTEQTWRERELAGDSGTVVGPVTFTLWLVEILTTGTCDLVMTEQGCKHQQSTQSISQVGLKGKSKTNTLRTFHFRNGSQSFRWNHLTQLHKTRLPTKTKTGTLCFRHLSQYEVWQVLKSMIYLTLVTQMYFMSVYTSDLVICRCVKWFRKYREPQQHSSW